MSGVSPKKDRSLLSMGLLLLGAIIAGPVIFYAVLALSDAGVFDNALDNFWLIVSIGVSLVVLWWLAVLYLGSRGMSADKNKEQLGG